MNDTLRSIIRISIGTIYVVCLLMLIVTIICLFIPGKPG